MKKISVMFLSVLALFLLKSTYCSAAEVKAEDITKGNKIVLSSGGNGNVLFDANKSSKLTLNKGTTIKILNQKAFSSIYVIWDKPVGEWNLSVNGIDYTYGKDGYLHEYIDLPFISNEVTITIPCDKAIICDVYTFTQGETPKWVEKWSPPYERADMLLMPTHADDEFIFFGGTIPYYAGELGLKVQVAYMTNHWGEPYRPHEMLNALWASGLKAYPVIGKFPDIASRSLEHAKTVYDYNKVIDYNVELIRRFKPMVIVGHDLKGEYGHGGHMINANALTEAIKVSADKNVSPESAEKYGVWDVPKTYLHLYENNKVKMNWDVPLKNFDGKTAFEMAEYSFSFHVSQQKWYKVKKTPGVYDCQAFGLYRTTVGNDTGKNDFLENITLYKEPVKESITDSSIVDTSLIDSSKTESTVEVVSKEVKNDRYKIFLIASVFLLIISLSIIAIRTKTNKYIK